MFSFYGKIKFLHHNKIQQQIFKKMMKKIILCTLLFLAAMSAEAQDLVVGNKFPIATLPTYKDSSHPKLVVLMPSLFVDCEYASMLTTAFQNYFIKGDAFDTENAPKIEVILVIKDKDKWNEKSLTNTYHYINRNQTNGMTLIYDSTGVVFQQLGINLLQPAKPTAANDHIQITTRLLSNFEPTYPSNQSSVLFLLDGQNNILYRDDDYRAQGEHLKPLENKIKSHFLNKKHDFSVVQLTPKAGDKATDFLLQGPTFPNASETFLSDRSSVKVITFYPAAFSGVLSGVRPFEAVTCIAQIRKFDLLAPSAFILNNGKQITVKKYAISNSTNKLLNSWQQTINTNSVIYLNDENLKIATAYNALNPKGYYNRVTYIIDKKGIIRYIDDDYTLEDERTLNIKLQEILK